jgi:hypothetical protein
MSHVKDMTISVEALTYLTQHIKCNNEVVLPMYTRITLQLYTTLPVLNVSAISQVEINHAA